MRVSNSLVVMIALGLNPNAVLAAEDHWKAERKAPDSEQPAICTPFATLVHGEIAKARALKAALKDSETAPPDSVFAAAQRWMGNKHETDWQREQKRLLEKTRSAALALNERYRDQRCGSIDVDQEIAREAPAQGYVPLKSQKPKERF